MSAGPREDAQLEGQVAALGDEPDRAGRELVRRQAEVGGGVEDAEAVRAEQHRPGRAHALDERPLAGLRLGAELAQAGRDADERPRADREGVVDRLLERRRRHRDRPPARGRPAGRGATRTRAGRGWCRRFGSPGRPGGGARPGAPPGRASCPTWQGRRTRRRSRPSAGRRGARGRAPCVAICCHAGPGADVPDDPAASPLEDRPRRGAAGAHRALHVARHPVVGARPRRTAARGSRAAGRRPSRRPAPTGSRSPA